jgi:hypothetical protein
VLRPLSETIFENSSDLLALICENAVRELRYEHVNRGETTPVRCGRC